MDDKNLIQVQTKEINFPSSEILQLRSYYLSSTACSDSAEIIICYNHKENALDYINLSTLQLSQTKLQDDGPNAITRLTGIYAYRTDSIWLFDESERIFLIDRYGEVLSKINIRDFLKESEQLIINTNHAMSTVHLGYNPVHNSLLFTIKDKSTSPVSFKVKELFLNKSNKTRTFILSASILESDINKGYANMSEPNVNFNNECIIYNYPIESHIYTIDLTTGIKKTIIADSRYTQNIAEKCTSTSDYSIWERHGIENPHFFDVMYLPKHEMFARIHLDKINFDATKSLEDMAYKRDLYLTILSKDFNIVYEAKLPSNRLNPYTGWTVVNDRIIFFASNIHNKNDTDNLILDIISPAF